MERKKEKYDIDEIRYVIYLRFIDYVAVTFPSILIKIGAIGRHVVNRNGKLTYISVGKL